MLKPRWCSLRAVLVVLALLFGVGIATANPAAAAEDDAPAKAVTWAEGFLGQTKYDSLCLQFVSDAYKNGANVSIGSSDSAKTYWYDHSDGKNTDTNPPLGALVFWDATTGKYPNPYGHVALSLGDGKVISSYERSDHTIHEFLIKDRNAAGYSYLGWMMPPGVTAPTGSSTTNPAPPPVVNHPEGVATVAYNGTLQAFYHSRGSGNLRHAVMNSAGSWSNFENLDGNAGSIAGQLGSYGTQAGTAVTAIVFNNTLYVFYYAASSGNLRVMWTSPTQGWQVTNLDGDVGSLAWQAGNYATHTGQSISAAVFGSTLQVFYTADGGRVRHAVKNASGSWSNFENLDGNAGSIASQIGPYTTANASVSSVVDASGVLHVFYPTSDGKLRHMWTSATQGWQLQSLDGDVGSVAGQLNSGSFATPAGGVNSIVDSSGVLRVFYNTTAGLRTMWTSATQTWQVTNLDGDAGSLAGQTGNYGTNIGASISSAVDASGAIQLVYPANGELRHAVKSTTGSWSNFENLDGNAGSIAGQLGSYGANVGNPVSVSVLGSTIQILYRQASNGDMRTMTTTPPTSGWAVTNLDGDPGSLAGQTGNYGTDLG